MKFKISLSSANLKAIYFCAILILMVSVNSCNNNKSNITEISGKIENASGRTVYLEELSPGKTQTVATATIKDDGTFKIRLDSISDSFHRMKIDDNNVIYLRIIDGDKIEISAKYPGIVRNYEIQGSEDCKLLKEMNLRLIKSSDILNELKNKVNESALIPDYNTDSLWEVTNETARELYKSDKEFLTDFIKKNNKSAVIYMALYQYIGPSPILMIENEPEIFDFVLTELKKYHPELEQTALLESDISKNKLKETQKNRDYVSLSPGVDAPDFVLPDVNSKKTSLSAFKGNNVIICFWSSWSKKSVESVSELINYEKIPRLKIILVSLDTQPENWESAIKSNKLENMINLCDFKTWEGSVVKIYGIKTLPSFVLLDSEGKIELLTDDFDKLNAGLQEIK